VCVLHCAQNTAENRPDNFPSYPPVNHYCSDDVYLREGGVQGWCKCSNALWSEVW